MKNRYIYPMAKALAGTTLLLAAGCASATTDGDANRPQVRQVAQPEAPQWKAFEEASPAGATATHAPDHALREGDGASAAAVGEEPASGDPEAILARARDLVLGAESYRVESTGRTSGSMYSVDGTPLDLVWETSIVYHRFEPSMQSETKLSIFNGTRTTETSATYTYVVDGFAYLRSAPIYPAPETVQFPWMKATLTPRLSQELGLAELGEGDNLWMRPEQVRYLRSEEVDGVDCHVLATTASEAERLALIGEEVGYGAYPMEWFDAYDGHTVVPVAESVLWIDKDSGYLLMLERKTVLDQTASPDWPPPWSIGLGATDVYTTTLSSRVYDYNHAPAVTLPPDAASATEVPPNSFMH